MGQRISCSWTSRRPMHESVRSILQHPQKPVCCEMLQRASELAGSCEQGNELLGSVRREELLG
jgi:hypothetical protein